MAAIAYNTHWKAQYLSVMSRHITHQSWHDDEIPEDMAGIECMQGNMAVTSSGQKGTLIGHLLAEVRDAEAFQQEYTLSQTTLCLLSVPSTWEDAAKELLSEGKVNAGQVKDITDSTSPSLHGTGVHMDFGVPDNYLFLIVSALHMLLSAYMRSNGSQLTLYLPCTSCSVSVTGPA
jgi:hypothetical protein